MAAGGTFDAASADRLQLTSAGNPIAAINANPILVRVVMALSCNAHNTPIVGPPLHAFVESTVACR
jgi:hypothetical protein